MKKGAVVALSLAVVATLAMTACGGKGEKAPVTQVAPATSTAAAVPPTAVPLPSPAVGLTPAAAPTAVRVEGTPTPTPFGARVRRGPSTGVAPQPTSIAPLTPRAQAAWTVMVYMVADNNLEPFGLLDAQEMASVGSSPSVNVLLQMDRHGAFSSDALLNIRNFDTAKRFYVRRGSLEELADLGEADSGDPAVLADFVRWAATNFPARNYALVLWDHGGAWRGIGLDETNGSFLTLPALGQALAATNVRFSVLGMDACLMAAGEVVVETSSYASILVASQELEPGDGWDYQAILSFLTQNPGADASALSKAIVDSYISFYEAVDPEQATALTMSAIDLSQAGNIVTAMKTLSDAVQKDLAAARTDKEKALLIASLEAARVQAPGFGRTNPFESGSFFDLGSLTANTALFMESRSVQEAANAVAAAVGKATIYQKVGSARQGSTGLQFFYPGGFRIEPVVAGQYENTRFDQASGWLKVLEGFNALRGIDRSPPVFGQPRPNADFIRPGTTTVEVAGVVSDDFYVAEFEGLVVGQVGRDLVLFEQAPFASLYLPSAPFFLSFDGLEFTVADAATAPQYVGVFNFSALEEEEGIGALSGVYTSTFIPEGLSSMLLFDMKTGKVIILYDVSGSQAPIFIEPGSTFTPFVRTVDPVTFKFSSTQGKRLSLDSLKIERRPLPPGDYQIILLADDFGGNRGSVSIPIRIAAP